jgi:hypothetical protein
MADIGSLLRETRIRNKIDITTVEEATKIRAKYLRALENEEWILLPGPTYVKTFLRTYAQFLGLDPHLLVEEYSARFEEPEELDVAAFAPKRRLPERTRRMGPPTRGIAVALFVLGFLAFLLVLGLTGNDEPSGGQAGDRAPAQGDRQAAAGEGSRKKRQQAAAPAPAARKRVRLEVLAARPVWVCVVDDSDRERVGGVVLAAGDREGPFRSRSFRVTVGNGGGDLRIDGRRRDTPDRSVPLGYRVRPSGVTVLGEASRPTCG